MIDEGCCSIFVGATGLGVVSVTRTGVDRTVGRSLPLPLQKQKRKAEAKPNRAGAELSYGKVWQSPYLEFSAIIFLESLYTMNRLRNIKFPGYEVWVASQR
jgi:hypothetical protein